MKKVLTKLLTGAMITTVVLNLFTLPSSAEPNFEAVASATYMEVDLLSEIEEFTAAIDEELRQMGANMDAVAEQRKELEMMDSMTDQELASKLDISRIEASYIHKAILSGENRRVKDQGVGKTHKIASNTVTASGAISSADLGITLTKSSSSVTSSSSSYNLKVAWEWKNAYINIIFEDKVAVAWGGSMSCDSISAYTNLDQSNFTKWKSTSVFALRGGFVY